MKMYLTVDPHEIASKDIPALEKAQHRVITQAVACGILARTFGVITGSEELLTDPAKSS